MIKEKIKKQNIFKLIIVIVFLFVFAVIMFFIGLSYTREPDQPSQEVGFICGQDFIDPRDNKNYATIELAGACWFAENLKFSPGQEDELKYMPERTEWRQAGEDGIPAYSFYENNAENADFYGYLYNWHAVNKTLLCPQGWRVPSDGEWHELEQYFVSQEAPCNDQRKGSLGCSPAGAKLKMQDNIHGTALWNSADFNCGRGGLYDCSGFNALPAGSRYSSGTFFGIGGGAYFWSSSAAEENSAWGRNLREKETGTLRNSFTFSLGMPIRCVKD